MPCACFLDVIYVGFGVQCALLNVINTESVGWRLIVTEYLDVSGSVQT